MNKHLKPLFAVIIGAFLASCAHQAGSPGYFEPYGNSTQGNNVIQAAYGGDPDALIQNLASKFNAEVEGVINFDFNKSRIAGAANARLDKQAAWLKANPAARVRIYGHTDLVGSERYNNGLGLRRARAAMAYLTRKGISRARMDAVESRGESEPVVQTQARERANRRTVTAVVGLTRGYVGDGMDGKRARLMYGRYATDTVEKPKTVKTGG